MKTYRNLPIYVVELPEDEEGMYRISLVSSPAVESEWEAFDKVQEPEYFKVEDEERKMITGCFLRADYPILRKRTDEDGNEEYYYITFPKEVIRTMVMKWMAENRQNEVNTDHKKNTEVEGIYLQEVYIKDSGKGISPKGFEDISEGSAFATYQVTDDGIWEKIKSGEWKGFSIEMLGSFTPREESEEAVLDDIINILKKLNTK